MSSALFVQWVQNRITGSSWQAESDRYGGGVNHIIREVRTMSHKSARDG